MASIIIQSENSDNLDLLSKLAKKMGDHVDILTEEQFEDITFGNVIAKTKTGESLTRESIMQKFDS